MIIRWTIHSGATVTLGRIRARRRAIVIAGPRILPPPPSNRGTCVSIIHEMDVQGEKRVSRYEDAHGRGKERTRILSRDSRRGGGSAYPFMGLRFIFPASDPGDLRD